MFNSAPGTKILTVQLTDFQMEVLHRALKAAFNNKAPNTIFTLGEMEELELLVDMSSKENIRDAMEDGIEIIGWAY